VNHARRHSGAGATSRRGALTALLAGASALLAPTSRAHAAPAPEAPVGIEVQARPLSGFENRDSSRHQFGALEYRGGLVLTSPFKQFGGLSALRVQPDGARFIALNDRGWWFRGRLVYDDTRPVGIADAEMAPMLGPDGRALTARGWYDTEALGQDGGTLYVAVERVHQIVRFNYGRDGLLARGTPIPTPAAMRSLPSNRGVESLVFVPRGFPLSGTLIAISERGLDQSGNVRGFLIGGPAAGGTFSVKRHADFDISDAALLPDGNLLLLERKFSWTRGVYIRLRHVPLAQLRPDAVIDGQMLLEADLGYEIDNMEGLSVHRGAAGETVLTLISDDNFSIIQRTLLLQFTLAET
jgi:hypothetical protein